MASPYRSPYAGNGQQMASPAGSLRRPAGGDDNFSVADSDASGLEKLQCICSICTCGAHHCPPPPGPRLAFDATTSYRQEYPEHPICPVHRHVVTMPPRPHIPFDGTTSYQMEYTPKEIERRQAPAAQYFRPSIPFEGTTETRERFVPHEIERPRVSTGGTPQRPKIPFQGTSSYQEEYTPKEIERRESPSRVAVRPSLPFEGSTETRDAYKEHPLPHPMHTTVSPQRRQLPDDRDFATETRREYTPKALAVCPAALLAPPPASALAASASLGGHVIYDRRTGRPAALE